MTYKQYRQKRKRLENARRKVRERWVKAREAIDVKLRILDIMFEDSMGGYA